MNSDPKALAQRGAGSLRVIGKLKKDLTVEQAQADMGSIASRLSAEFPDTNADITARVSPLHEEIVGQTRPIVLMLSVACALVLIIVCANLASLMMTRSLERQKEIAIRMAVGARRSHVIRQLLTENVLLSLLGGVTAFLLTVMGNSLLIQFIPEDFPRKGDVTIDGWGFGCTLAIAAITGVVFGSIPALIQSRPNLNKSLKDSILMASGGVRPHSFRNILIMLEVGLTLMLMIGASLVLTSVFRLQTMDMGFDPRDRLTMSISLSREKYQKPLQQAGFFSQTIEEIGSLSGVESTALVMPLPLDGNKFTYPFGKAGDEGKAMEELPKAFHSRVSSSYFQTMNVSLLTGREFTDQDGPQSPAVAIINETMARQFWPDGDTIGSHIYLNKKALTIVGVVKDVKQSNLDNAVTPHIYQPYLQSPSPSMYLIVSGPSNLAALIPAIRKRILALDAEQPLQNIALMDDRRDKWIGERQLALILLSSFATMALLIAAFGIYAVVAHNMTHRTQEIGIRVALGARPKDILKLVLKQGLAVILIGIGIGLVGAFSLTHLLSSWLYGVQATDPVIVVAASLMLAAVALLACYVPARRAIKVDPVTAIRYE